MEQQRTLTFNIQHILTRSPRLETIMMVEQFIKEHSGEYKKTEVFNKVPKKTMWGTFNVILKYLWDTNKIGIDNNGYIIYIWSPEAGNIFKNRKRY
ncbi:MAG TPA: hypothetical protein VJK51_01200 [Candidatus Nanoarchaeia archaeon]|nr:hypothetical protein [Candidatus Nanoarchaeia archaeon]